MTVTDAGPTIGLDYESTLGLHVIDLTRLDQTSDRLTPEIAAMWWFDTLDDQEQMAMLDELEASANRQEVIRRHEASVLADANQE